MEKKERIAKVMAAAGCCSRRDAERWIEQGRVKLNGVALTTPAQVVGEEDKIEVDGKPLPKKEQARLWLYYKPVGLVTTHSDPQGRPTVFQSLPKDMPRVVSVGRLDLNSEGLLLLTNSGELKRQFELPSNVWKRVYRVRVFGKITAEMLGRLAKGVKVDGMAYAPMQVRVMERSGANTWLEMILTEGKNREIRKLVEFFGGEVNRLIRISYGPYELGNMKPGEVRPCVFSAEN